MREMNHMISLNGRPRVSLGDCQLIETGEVEPPSPSYVPFVCATRCYPRGIAELLRVTFSLSIEILLGCASPISR